MKIGALGLAAVLISGPVPTHGQESPVVGGEMFAEQICHDCHAVKDDEGNYLVGAEYSVGGPNLFDIIGRPAASVEGFDYSEAMISAREAGLVWTVENLDGFLINPTQFLREFLGDDTVLSTMSPRHPENEVRGLLLQDLVAFSPHTATSEDLDAVRAIVPPSQRGEMFAEQKCHNCHAVIDDDGNYLAGAEYSVRGPNLFDIVGRPAASVKGFDYSEAMTSAREAGLVWTVEDLDGFLMDPTRFLREFLGDAKAQPNMGERVPEGELRGPLLEDLVAFSPDTATSKDLDAVRVIVLPSQ